MGNLKVLLLLCICLMVFWSVSARISHEKVKRSVTDNELIGKAKRRSDVNKRMQVWTEFMNELKTKNKGPPMVEMLAKIDGANYDSSVISQESRLQLWYMQPLAVLWQKIMGSYAVVSKFLEQLYQGNIRDEIDQEGLLEENAILLEPGARRPQLAKGQCPFFKVRCTSLWWKQYRTFEGTCNNLKPGRELWGSANTPQNRFLEPDYADVVDAPRKSINGVELPSAREVTLGAFTDKQISSQKHSVMMVNFGQFLDHDLTHTPSVTAHVDPITGANTGIDCGTDGCSADGETRSDCFPIKTPAGDPVYGPAPSCLPFVRSAPSVDLKCSFKKGVRQSINSITSYIDMSSVYGSSYHETEQLRENEVPDRGRMKVNSHPVNHTWKPLLPYHKDETSGCVGLNNVVKCFHAGDIRQNEQVGLTSLHTVFVRLHNNIEYKIHQMAASNGNNWGNAKLFQETRKVMIAFWQKIVYSEYLPLVLGDRLMDKYELRIKNSGFFEGYDESVNSQIFSGFSTAAFRFGHSQIPDNMTFTDRHYRDTLVQKFSNIIFKPASMYYCPFAGKHDTSGIDSILLGAAANSAGKTDSHFADMVSHALFSSNGGLGFDLRALNIQRGRDHGLPGYVHWRKKCGLYVPQTFEDLANIAGLAGMVSNLKALYDDVRDIDLYVGGISETPVQGGVVGETFGCLIAEQFKRLKLGDRFYFENKHQYGFNEDQLREIRKVTFARILCDTLDNVGTIQPNPLLQPDQGSNKRVTCDQIPNINYNVFL